MYVYGLGSIPSNTGKHHLLEQLLHWILTKSQLRLLPHLPSHCERRIDPVPVLHKTYALLEWCESRSRRNNHPHIISKEQG
mmetsp:Transcript_4439/g.9274  ORF Transcript_4439/g.9274 Transcript_4439/m.9274 type:complete len:81 (-) Transcript_4439:1228-1470(-)